MEYQVNARVTKFQRVGAGGKAETNVVPIIIDAAENVGEITFSARATHKVAVTVRMDELLTILARAYGYVKPDESQEAEQMAEQAEAQSAAEVEDGGE